MTPAIIALQRLKLPFEVVKYDYNADATSIGRQAADAIGIEPRFLLKTLILRSEDRFYCVVCGSDQDLHLKSVARAVGAKTVRLATVQEAESATGYRVGGISPLGQRRQHLVALDARLDLTETIHVNGGRRGVQLKMIVEHLVAATHARRISLV